MVESLVRVCRTVEVEAMDGVRARAVELEVREERALEARPGWEGKG